MLFGLTVLKSRITDMQPAIVLKSVHTTKLTVSDEQWFDSTL